jgi:pimeloyl-ACP methyl ester carboxylesterase
LSEIQANPETPLYKTKAPAFAPGDPSNNSWEECWMPIDGARMRYLRAGSGPPLILLHGLLGYSFSWRFTLPALAPYATVYALDLLGAGFSDRPHGLDHSMRATAQRVLRFADNLGLGRFDLLGTSRGGAVAMSAAAESIDGAGISRVRRLILVCPVNPFSAHGKFFAPFCGSRFVAPIVRGVLEHVPLIHAYSHRRMYGDRHRIRPGALEGYRAPLSFPGLFEHAISIAHSWTADLHELEAILPKLASIPTFLMWGSKDIAVYPSSLEPLQRHFPNSRSIVFPGIGHLPYEECPEEFNLALIDFLKSTADASLPVGHS